MLRDTDSEMQGDKFEVERNSPTTDTKSEVRGGGRQNEQGTQTVSDQLTKGAQS